MKITVLPAGDPTTTTRGAKKLCDRTPLRDKMRPSPILIDSRYVRGELLALNYHPRVQFSPGVAASGTFCGTLGLLMQ